MNAVCPNVVQTNISSPNFYEKLGAQGLLVDMKSVVMAFEEMMGEATMSGECLEVSPAKTGFTLRAPVEVLDRASQETLDLIYERSRSLVEP